jgi:hypothetical protein
MKDTVEITPSLEGVIHETFEIVETELGTSLYLTPVLKDCLSNSFASSNSELNRSSWTTYFISKRELSKRALTDCRIASCC